MVDVARLEADRQERARSSTRRRRCSRASSSCTSSTRCSATAACRLGITYPEITEMQTRAIIEAACRLNKEGAEGRARDHDPARRPREGAARSEGDRRSRRRRDDEGAGRQGQVPGRHDDRGAARRGDRRRDRRRGAVLLVRHQRPHAADLRLLARRRREVPEDLPGQEDPRAAIRSPRSTPTASARSCAIGVERGRKTRPDLKIGICGEHGGDPASIHFFDKVGLDYVSASPYRVPVARLAAAQAALAVKVGD